MKYMTAQQVFDACQKHRYLIFRSRSGYKMGVNGGSARLARKRGDFNPEQETDFVSYQPCDLMEYIEHKHPFLT